MRYQHAKYVYPDSMTVFKRKTHSSRKGKQREVEGAAKPTQRTPCKGKWQNTEELSSPKDAATCWTAWEPTTQPGAEVGTAENGGAPG